MKKIIYETEQGISIIHSTGELTIEKVFEKDVPEQYKSTAKIVDDSFEFPTDRYFRNAWKLNNDKIVEDLETAKEIQKNVLREQRKPLLDNLDIAFMRALEAGNETAEITNEKQRLRDITKLCDACFSCEELREVKL